MASSTQDSMPSPFEHAVEDLIKRISSIVRGFDADLHASPEELSHILTWEKLKYLSLVQDPPGDMIHFKRNQNVRLVLATLIYTVRNLDDKYFWIGDCLNALRESQSRAASKFSRFPLSRDACQEMLVQANFVSEFYRNQHIFVSRSGASTESDSNSGRLAHSATLDTSTINTSGSPSVAVVDENEDPIHVFEEITGKLKIDYTQIRAPTGSGSSGDVSPIYVNTKYLRRPHQRSGSTTQSRHDAASSLYAIATDGSPPVRGQIYALKKFRNKSDFDRESEIQLALAGLPGLRSEHILYCVSSGTGDGCLSMLFPWAEHLTLRHVFDNQVADTSPLSDRRGNIIQLTQVADALAKLIPRDASQKGFIIIHGDVSPENILIFPGPGGTLCFKITDFGCAQRISRSDLDFANKSKIIGDQTIPKAETFAAPEVCKDNVCTLTSDVWSLGAVFFELMCFNWEGGMNVVANFRKRRKEGHDEDTFWVKRKRDSIFSSNPPLKDNLRSELRRFEKEFYAGPWQDKKLAARLAALLEKSILVGVKDRLLMNTFASELNKILTDTDPMFLKARHQSCAIPPKARDYDFFDHSPEGDSTYFFRSNGVHTIDTRSMFHETQPAVTTLNQETKASLWPRQLSRNTRSCLNKGVCMIRNEKRYNFADAGLQLEIVKFSRNQGGHNAVTDSQELILPVTVSRITRVAISPDGEYLATSSIAMDPKFSTIRIWSVATLSDPEQRQGIQDLCDDPKFSERDGFFEKRYSSLDRQIRVEDLRFSSDSRRLIAIVPCNSYPVRQTTVRIFSKKETGWTEKTQTRFPEKSNRQATFWNDHCGLNYKPGCMVIVNDREVHLVTVDREQSSNGERQVTKPRYVFENERSRHIMVTNDDKVAIIVENENNHLKIFGAKLEHSSSGKVERMLVPEQIEYEDKYQWVNLNVDFWLWKSGEHTYLMIMCGRKAKLHRIDLTWALSRFA